MNRHRIMPLLVLGLVVLAPVIAEAAGQITGVTATPSPATVDHAVTITVTGTDTCGSIDLYTGDQYDPINARFFTLHDVTFPKTFSYSYTTPGSYRIRAQLGRAQLGASCQGAAHFDLKVQAAASYTTKLHQLAQHPVVVGATGGAGGVSGRATGSIVGATGGSLSGRAIPIPGGIAGATGGAGGVSGQPTPGGSQGGIDIGGAGQLPPPPPPPLPPPQIIGAIQDESPSTWPKDVWPKGEPWIYNARPWYFDFVRGVHFGTAPGRLELWLVKYTGETIKSDLWIQDWSDTFILALVPPDISGVLDQPGVLRVVRGTGQHHNEYSNEWPANFQATRDTKLLTGGAVKVVSCSHRDWEGGCQAGGAVATFAAVHSSRWEPGCDAYSETYTLGLSCIKGLITALGNSASGSDDFMFCLKNDWVYDHYEWSYQDNINGGPKFTSGQNGCTRLSQAWFYDVLGSASYYLNIIVRGPRGVPEQ